MDYVLYFFVGFLLACTSIAVVLMNGLFVALCSVLGLAGIVVYKGWDLLFEPLIFRRAGIVQVLGNYELSGDRRAAIGRSGGRFTATAAALLDASQIEELDRGKFEGVIEKTGKPFKLVMVSQPLDVSGVLDRLKTMKYRGEIQLARLGSGEEGSMKRKRLLERISSIEGDIRSITSGKVPLKMLYYLLHSSSSESSFAAQEEALSGLSSLCNAFDAALNTRSSILSGSELLSLLKIDSMVL